MSIFKFLFRENDWGLPVWRKDITFVTIHDDGYEQHQTHCYRIYFSESRKRYKLKIQKWLPGTKQTDLYFEAKRILEKFNEQNNVLD